MVDTDGKNYYPTNAVWMTDGYGDYARHYLRAMGAFPELAPPASHVVYSSSVVQHVFYSDQMNKYYYPAIKDPQKTEIHYTTYDTAGNELIRLANKPAAVFV